MAEAEPAQNVTVVGATPEQLASLEAGIAAVRRQLRVEAAYRHVAETKLPGQLIDAVG